MKDSSGEEKEGTTPSRNEWGNPDPNLASHSAKLGSWEHSSASMYDTPAGELVLERYDWDYCGSDWVDFFVISKADAEQLAAAHSQKDLTSLIDWLANKYKTLDKVLEQLEKQDINMQRSHTTYA